MEVAKTTRRHSLVTGITVPATAAKQATARRVGEILPVVLTITHRDLGGQHGFPGPSLLPGIGLAFGCLYFKKLPANCVREYG